MSLTLYSLFSRERILNGLRISNDLVSTLNTIPQITCSVKGNPVLKLYCQYIIGDRIYHTRSIWRISYEFLERVGDSDEKNFTSVKEFIADTVKSVTEPEQPRLTIIFQWNPEIEFTSNDFTDNLLDACNYKILCAIQG